VAYKADGKSLSCYRNPDADSVTPKSVNARTWDFTLTKAGKVVGTVHRVVSADGKTLTVNNKGTHNDGVAYDDTLVFTRHVSEGRAAPGTRAPCRVSAHCRGGQFHSPRVHNRLARVEQPLGLQSG